MNSPVFHPTPQTTRTFDQIVGDVNLFRQAKAIREWLCELSGLIPRLNEGPNPYYQGTVDGLTLVQYYGSPSCVGTPFGSWAATGGGCLSNGSWFEEAKERLGLVVVMDEFQNSQGCYGPVHAITKDLEGNPLPLVDYRPSHINVAGLVSATAFIPGMLPFVQLQKEVEASEPSDHFKESIEAIYSKLTVLLLSYEGAQRIYDEFSYELAQRRWNAMKLNIGFRDWRDEEASA
jgi:hypothetical protein